MSLSPMEKKLLKQRTLLLDRLEDISERLQLFGSETSVEEYELLYSDLGLVWDKFEVLQDNLSEHSSTETFVEHRKEYRNALSQYNSLRTSYSSKRAKLPPSAVCPLGAVESDVPSESTIKLPRLNVPSFDGQKTKWLSFRDLFTNAVHHKKNLSGAEKLQFLRGSLSGEPLSLIESYTISDRHYDQAWNHLCDRYDNPKDLLFAHLERFLSIPKIHTPSNVELTGLVDRVGDFARILEILGHSIEGFADPFIVHILMEKLDDETLFWFDKTLQPKVIPTFVQLTEFLANHARSLTKLTPVVPITSTHRPIIKSPIENKRKVLTNRVSSGCCSVCQQSHSIFACPTLRQSPVTERFRLIKSKKLCFNCLSPAHTVTECTSIQRCKLCNSKHHTLLHKEITSPLAPVNPSVVGFSRGGKGQVLLSTALIRVQSQNGRVVECRCLLDSGSQSSFITESCLKRLGLRLNPSQVRVSCLGSSDSQSVVGQTSLIFGPWFSDEQQFSSDVLVIGRITGDLPTCKGDVSSFNLFRSLRLADPRYHVPAPIDILLGIDFSFTLVDSPDVIRHGDAFAVSTALGYIVGGRLPVFVPRTPRRSGDSIVRSHFSELVEDSILQKFWELEEIPSVCNYTEEEKACEEHYVDHVARGDSGRYEVALPFKSSPSVLGNSFNRALQQFRQMEKHLARNSHKYSLYRDFMREYRSLGHMVEVFPSGGGLSKDPHYYLPHHAVLKEDSTSTKLRVVFNGSAKTTSGHSLNDILMVGPSVQDDLFHLVLRFRFHLYAFSADIAKMYRQIQVRPEDRPFQRVLWRDSPFEPIRHYELTTVTYGTSSASFLATRSLKQLATDESGLFPEASVLVDTDFYVDDLVSGAESKERASLLVSQLNTVLSRGGFPLRKWVSNCPAILSGLPVELLGESPRVELGSSSVKTLGLHWNPTSDSFTFCPRFDSNLNYFTKRIVLSIVAKVFDPLGWLSPCIVSAKIFLQTLWQSRVDWDEPLPLDLGSKWLLFYSEMSSLGSVVIPRCVTIPDSVRFELHGFCDACPNAYAAVIYVKVISSSHGVRISLLTSKTRVAPLKHQSLPRLELCGALLLAHLFTSAVDALRRFDFVLHAWTDSTIALNWIASPSRRWKSFVANRVSVIQQTIPSSSWHHVCGKSNPADCASRGICPSQLLSHSLWWSGPPWLSGSAFSCQCLNPLHSVLLEEKAPPVLFITLSPASLLTRYSSLVRLKRVTAFCLRFGHNALLRGQSDRLVGPLTAGEIELAFDRLVLWAQQVSYPREILACQQGVPVSLKSPILSLNPFLDSCGFLRVGGRIRHANVSHDAAHQLILPYDCHLSYLLFVQLHLDSHHAGPQLLLAEMRTRFWVPRARALAKRVVHRCIRCFRFSAKFVSQMMGDLPLARVTPSPPFNHTGVDFAGPYLLRSPVGRKSTTYKAYISLFICFTTKAIHLEVVGALTSVAFVAAFRRFVARRGKPSTIYSDQGTNFVGAARHLGDLAKEVLHSDDSSFNDFLSTENIIWKFNPPHAPNFGGLWEAGVKSVKRHLARTMSSGSFLTFEEFSTLLCQIEACLNSRPIAPISDSSSDSMALTPAHFLIGRSLLSVPQRNVADVPSNHLTRWNLIQQNLQHFWVRWRKEYLSQLQSRSKWHASLPPLVVGDVVLLKIDFMPPNSWPLGRIEQLFPGPDGIARVALIRTQTSLLKRPLSKVTLLPQ